MTSLQHSGVDVTAMFEKNDWATVALTTEALHLWRDVYDLAPQYFNRPDEDKSSDRLKDGYGYRSIGAEYSQSVDRPDPFESFTAGELTRTIRFGSALARSLNERMLKVVDAANTLAENMLQQLALRFFVPRSSMDTFIRRSREWSCLQLNFSRPASVAAEYIHEEHEDGHLLTLASAMDEGLEIKLSDGSFYPVTPKPPDLLIMPGNILTLLTGGIIPPLYHRVRAIKSVLTRCALVYFVDPDPRTCTPWVASEINREVDIGSYVLANPARFGLDPLPSPRNKSREQG